MVQVHKGKQAHDDSNRLLGGSTLSGIWQSLPPPSHSLMYSNTQKRKNTSNKDKNPSEVTKQIKWSAQSTARLTWDKNRNSNRNIWSCRNPWWWMHCSKQRNKCSLKRQMPDSSAPNSINKRTYINYKSNWGSSNQIKNMKFGKTPGEIAVLRTDKNKKII